MANKLQTNLCCCCPPCEESSGICCDCVCRCLCVYFYYPDGPCFGEQHCSGKICWNGLENRWTGEACSMDLSVSIERDPSDGQCYLYLEIECAGLVGDYRPRKPFSDQCTTLDETFSGLDLSDCTIVGKYFLSNVDIRVACQQRFDISEWCFCGEDPCGGRKQVTAFLQPTNSGDDANCSKIVILELTTPLPLTEPPCWEWSGNAGMVNILSGECGTKTWVWDGMVWGPDPDGCVPKSLNKICLPVDCIEPGMPLVDGTYIGETYTEDCTPRHIDCGPCTDLPYQEITLCCVPDYPGAEPEDRFLVNGLRPDSVACSGGVLSILLYSYMFGDCDCSIQIGISECPIPSQ